MGFGAKSKNPGDVLPPTVPTGVTATITGQGEITLTWNASTDAKSSVLEYRVTRVGTGIIHTVSFIAPRQRVWTGLPVGTYEFQVRSVDEHGNVSNPGTSAAVTIAPPPVGNVEWTFAQGPSEYYALPGAYAGNTVTIPATLYQVPEGKEAVWSMVDKGDGSAILDPSVPVITLGETVAPTTAYQFEVDLSVPVTTAEQDWVNRSTLPGTVFAHDFRNANEVKYFARPGPQPLGPTDVKWEAGGLAGTGSGRLVSPVYGSTLAQNVSVAASGAIENWLITDASLFPDPAFGSYRLFMGTTMTNGEYVLVTARDGNTLTVTRGYSGPSGAVTTPKAFTTGTKIGCQSEFVWERPLCAIPGTRNGKGVDDIGITQGHSTARMYDPNDENSLNRNPYGHWGEEKENWPTWSDAYNRVWTEPFEGTEFYLQFRVKFSASRFQDGGVGKWFYLTGWGSCFQQIFSTWEATGVPIGVPLWRRTFGDGRAPSGPDFSSGAQAQPGGDYASCAVNDQKNTTNCFSVEPEKWYTFLFYLKPCKSNYFPWAQSTLAADINTPPIATQPSEQLAVADGTDFASTLATLGPFNAQISGPTISQNVYRELVRVTAVSGNTVTVTRNILRTHTTVDPLIPAGSRIEYGYRNSFGVTEPLSWINDPNLCPYRMHFKVSVADETESVYRVVFDNANIPHVYGYGSPGDYGNGKMNLPGISRFLPQNYANAYLGSTGSQGPPNTNRLEFTQIILSRNPIPCPVPLT